MANKLTDERTIGARIAALLVADSVPLSDAWKMLIDDAEHVELQERRKADSSEPVADVVAWHKDGEERTCDIRWRRFDVEPGPLYAVPQIAPIFIGFDFAFPKAWNDVMDERIRQSTEEGNTKEHDDVHIDGELASAAICYMNPSLAESYWPWSDNWWKPTNYRRNLVKAGALILAEIERFDRQEANNAAE